MTNPRIAQEQNAGRQRETDHDRGQRGAIARKRPDHEHIAVRKVDELEHAVHHRVSDSDQRIDRPERQAVDELLEEFLHEGKWSVVSGQWSVGSI